MSLPPQTPLFESVLAAHPDVHLPEETDRRRREDAVAQSSPEFAERTLAQLARAGREIVDLRDASRGEAMRAAERIGPGSAGSLVIVVPDAWLVGNVPHAATIRRLATEHRVHVFALPSGGLL